MVEVTVRLPASLHQSLTQQAERERVSLNHYIVDALTRTVTTVDLEAQRQAFEELTPPYAADEAETALRDLLTART